MLLLFKFLSIILIFFLINETSGNDWCTVQEKSCHKKKHIGCITNQLDSSKDCTTSDLIDISEDLKYFILSQQNIFRNDLVEHKSQYSPKVQRMRELFWDDSLEYLASLHAQKCTITHDGCRNTMDYRNVKQKIGIYRTEVPSYNVNYANVIIMEIMQGWFREIEEQGHNENNFFRVGCAYTTYITNYPIDSKIYTHLLTCNYAVAEKHNIGLSSVKMDKNECTGCLEYGLKCSDTYNNMCVQMNIVEEVNKVNIKNYANNVKLNNFFNVGLLLLILCKIV